MQITLDELLNLIMARLDAMEMAVEDLKVRMNILMRVCLLYTSPSPRD